MKVFISYASEDRSIAERLSRYLAERGLDVSTDTTRVSLGDDLAERISEEISTSDAVIILISNRYERSRWSEFELSMAVYLQTKGKVKRILPVVTASGATVPPLLNGVLYLDAVGRSDDEVFSRILHSLRSNEPPAHLATQQLKSLNDQSQAFKLETTLSPRPAEYLTKSIIQVGSLLSIVGISLGLGLVATVGRHPPGWFEPILMSVLPLLSGVLGYFFGKRTGQPKSSEAIGAHESGAPE